jgi:hypothetical protein
MHDTTGEVGSRNSGIPSNVSSHMNTVLSKAKLTHHITENSANISIMRLSFHQASGNPIFLNKAFRLFS